MIRIAVVGEIGSGKTYVAKCFRYPMFNADEDVKKIYHNNNSCFNKLKKKFPKYINKSSTIKSDLKKILNKKNLNVISKIVHPYVSINLKKFIKKNRKKKFVMLDIPLLIENKLYNKSDILIYVKTSQKNIIQRLKNRGGYNKKVLNILKSQQLSKNKKKILCDFTIENNSSLNNVVKQIKKIKKIINDRSSSRY